MRIPKRKFGRHTLIFLLLASLLFEINGCNLAQKKSPFTSIHIPEPGSSSEVSEIGLGSQIHNVIVASQYLYTKPEVVNYVGQIGYSLAKNSLRPHLPYSFTILLDERLYSTAAPGGYVYLTTGLLNFFKNEAELAGVLAHEIGEIQRQPSAVSTLRKRSEDLAALTAVAASFFGPIGAAGAAGVILLANSPYGDIRKEDLLMQSDKLAVDMLTKSGYDPAALRDVLKRVEKTINNEQLQALTFEWDRKRPVTQERLQKLNDTISQISVQPVSARSNSTHFTQAMKSIYEMYPAR